MTNEDHAMFDSVALYVENRLVPEKKLVWWDNIGELFYISTQESHKSSIVGVLDPLQFFYTYTDWIKHSNYYIKYMAYILGSHANT